MTSSKVQLAFSVIAFTICFLTLPAEMTTTNEAICNSTCSGVGPFTNVVECCLYIGSLTGYPYYTGFCSFDHKAYCVDDN
ncbi:unnamed protein product, partial [Mesorhabditis belari]|uniref:Uncharacterized protein n=1 Tax=Mesorhabditis belari TaxID=2138241 RepID=A0AAF3EJQ1_9BILA